MKSLKEIKGAIKDIENMTPVEKRAMKPAQLKRMKKHLELLRLMEKYLETSPTSEFVKLEIVRLEKIVTAKAEEFERVAIENKYEKLPKKEVSKLKKAHEKGYDIPKYRTQIKALRFLAA